MENKCLMRLHLSRLGSILLRFSFLGIAFMLFSLLTGLVSVVMLLIYFVLIIVTFGIILLADDRPSFEPQGAFFDTIAGITPFVSIATLVLSIAACVCFFFDRHSKRGKRGFITSIVVVVLSAIATIISFVGLLGGN